MRQLFLLLSVSLLCFAANAGIVIVKDAAPRAVIVTAAEPSASATRAAEELQHFMELMSGAKLAIQTDAAPVPDGLATLAVGRSRLTGGVKVPSGTDRDFSSEGFILKTRGNSVVLAGNEDGDFNGKYHGTEYAVYELLERLGCRWYFPGDYGQVVPKLRTVELPDLDISQKPSFALRNIWTALVADSTGDLDTWLLRNKGTTRSDIGFAFPGDGSIQNLVPLAKYAKLYPEIYAMDKDGKRQDEKTPPHMTMPCMSSSKAVQLSAQTICDFFREHPDANSYGFSAPDAAAMCSCPLCTARMHEFSSDKGNLASATDFYSNFVFRSISDPYFNFVNNVAWEVNKTFPDKYIVTLAYATRVLPPEGLDRPWNPNIIIELAQYLTSTVRPIGTSTDVFALRNQRTLAGWTRMAPKMLIYDYDPHADLSRMPFWRSRAIAKDMKLYHRSNVVGFTTEGNNTFFRTGLNYYMRLRLMWDVNADPDAVLNDFYTHFFGAASTPMKQFTEGLETMLQTTPDHLAYQPMNYDWAPTYPQFKVEALGSLLDQAEKMADTPEVKQRLRLYRVLQNYMTSYHKVYSLQHEGRYQEALATMDTLPAIIDEAQKIQLGLLPPDVKWMAGEGMNFFHHKRQLTSLAEKVDGKNGELLGRAPREGEFLTDPRNIGLYEQWQRPEIGAKLKWNPIDLTRNWGLNGYRDEQGYAYDGIGWYRLKFKVKKPKQGRAQLAVPLVFAEKVWIWVNGQLVTSPSNMVAGKRKRTSDDEDTKDKDADKAVEPTPAQGDVPAQAVRVNDRGYVTLAVDIHDQLRMNEENTITMRMQGTLERVQHRGIGQIPFVWAPLK